MVTIMTLINYFLLMYRLDASWVFIDGKNYQRE